jgi:hypothetical protein
VPAPPSLVPVGFEVEGVLVGTLVGSLVGVGVD